MGIMLTLDLISQLGKCYTITRTKLYHTCSKYFNSEASTNSVDQNQAAECASGQEREEKSPGSDMSHPFPGNKKKTK